MNIRTLFTLALLSLTFSLSAQQSVLLSQRSLLYDDYPVSASWTQSAAGKKTLKPEYAFLDSIDVWEVTYLSDGLKIRGLMVTPRTKGRYPCIIYNRGGNREFGNLRASDAFIMLGRLARHGYVVIASYYRGNGGSEGREEFGGADVNDVLNLVHALREVKCADTANIGMYGWSRGGMMTFRALGQTHRIKAAACGGAPTDLNALAEGRPDLEQVYQDLIPNYREHRKAELQKRSAVNWPDMFCKTTPVLLLHGSADERVPAKQSEALANLLQKQGIQCRLEIIDGGDHSLNAQRTTVEALVLAWFDRYLKQDQPLAEVPPGNTAKKPGSR